MNEEFKEPVTEEVTENTVEQPVEEVVGGIELTDTADVETQEEKETPETEKSEEEQKPKGRYLTDKEINNIADKRLARKLRDIEKDMAVYKDTENVLKTVVGGKDIYEINKKLREGYESEGMTLPEPYVPGLNDRQIEILARTEANDIIEDGYESMVKSANELANKGYENLSKQEKIIFTTLAEKITEENDKKELLKIGVKEDVLSSDDFISFRKQFDSKTPVSQVYSLYSKLNPQKEAKPLGSMKDSADIKKTELKDFYTPEEVKQFTKEDWKKPGLWERVLASQDKWQKQK